MSNTMEITIQMIVFMIFSTQNKCKMGKNYDWKLPKYWPINNNDKNSMRRNGFCVNESTIKKNRNGLISVWMVTEFCAIW